MHDLGSAVRCLNATVEAVPEGALELPTPCEAYTVGDLLDHIRRFPVALGSAARKEPGAAGGEADASQLVADWRERIPADAELLAEAWRAPQAWEGMTAVAGIEFPAEVIGQVALGELVLHSWDLARATGQPAPSYDEQDLEAVLATATQFQAMGVPGVFDTPVAVPADAPLLDRALGAAGRDPGWAPSPAS